MELAHMDKINHNTFEIVGNGRNAIGKRGSYVLLEISLDALKKSGGDFVKLYVFRTDKKHPSQPDYIVNALISEERKGGEHAE